MSEQIVIALANIDPNPFQPRTSEDPEHIQQLAASILRDGLLQVPVAREMVGRFQLAFGHSRLAAYRQLVQDGHREFGFMPVDIRELDDQQMFEMAISENVARKNLSPIEEAQAMQRYRDEFGKTSVEIGELFGISDSTVRNKLRLLDLPEVAQEKLKTGELGEASSRRLLSLQRVRPDKVDDVVNEVIEKDLTPKETEQAIMARLERDKSVIRMWAKWNDQENPLAGDGLWPLDWEPAQSGMVCTACPQYVRLKGFHFCCNQDCYKKKKKEWCQEELTRISDEMGILAYSKAVDGKRFIERTWSNSNQFDKWVEDNAPNLRLRIHHQSYPHRHTNNNCVQMVSVNRDAIAAELERKNQDKQKEADRNLAYERRRQSNNFIEQNSIHFASLVGVPSLAVIDTLIKLAAWNVNDYDPDIPEEFVQKIALYQRYIAWELLDHVTTDDILRKGPIVTAAHLKVLAEAWGVDLPADWEEIAKRFENGEADGND